ncbi:MAG: uroporphyrinogen decarboxylase family protein [Armatimonadia bacterium]
MTAADRVRAALRHEETEHVPYNFMFSPPALRKLQDHLGCPDVEAWVGSHLHFFGTSDKPLYASPEKYGPTVADQWGVVWATSDRDRGYPVTHPLAHADLTGYQFPDPLEPRRWRHAALNASARPDLYRVAVVGDLWERAHFLCGLPTLLLALHDRPAFVHDLLDGILAYNIATLDRLAGFKPDAMFLSDDYGLQRSLMMSPGQWRTFIKPPLERLFAAARAHGCAMMLHTCGHVTEVIPDLIELGLDILHPIQPEAMDVYGLKREFGRDLTFCGGINTQQLLPCATPAEIHAEVNHLAQRLGRGGGYIIEPGITLQADIPLENLLAVIEAAKSAVSGA